MAQFLVLAYDSTDPEDIKGMVTRGEIIAGAAILDDGGNMIGSALFTQFPSRAELHAWLAQEPYVKQRVWQKIDVKPMRLAVLDGKITP